MSARRPRLYALPASHPCETVEAALRVKGLEYDRLDLIPVAHAPVQKLLFGRRTVPGVRFADGTKVVGSRAILREIERIAPEPPLLPADPALRARVEEAERWGDDVLQPIGRRLAWVIFRRRPDLMAGYAGGRLPLPDAVVRASGPLVAAIASRVNRATPSSAAADLAALPALLDHVDALIADGVLDGGETPNAADLQIGAGVRILLTFGDTAPLIEGRPAEAHARRWFPWYAGSAPAGALSADASTPAAGSRAAP